MATPMQITIGGSYRKHFSSIIDHKREFERLGAKILRPISEQIIDEQGDMIRVTGDPQETAAVAEAQRRAINRSDILYVVNPGGYVGPSGLTEMGYAYALGVLIATSEEPYERAAKELVTYIGKPFDLIDFIPKEALLLPLRERRLLGSLARQNLTPWIVAGTRWNITSDENGYVVSYLKDNNETVPFAVHNKYHGWTMHEGVSAEHEKALRELLIHHEQNIVHSK